MKYFVAIILFLASGLCQAHSIDSIPSAIGDSIIQKNKKLLKVRNVLEDSVNRSSSDIVFTFLKDSDIPITYGNRVKLLKSGREKFLDLFREIRAAKNHIHLEYFNFRNDSIATSLFDLLAQKAKEGVKVRCLFDAFGNWSNNRPLKKSHLKEIRDRGIEIVKFDPIRFPWVNHAAHRDHRKIAVIDGKVGFTGGMNIADYYIKGLPKIGDWRDMHIHIEGPAVNVLQTIFLQMWNKETKQNVQGKEFFPDNSLASVTHVPDSLANDSAASPYVDSVTIAIVDRTPLKTSRMISHTYALSIASARNYVRIVNPYFVPTTSIYKAIKYALKKGTKVQIMISMKNDIPFTPEASMYKVHKLMKLGAEIYLYEGGFHHSKIMMVDSTFCTVGTANLNSRSLRYDYETNAFIFDKRVTAQLDKVYDKDMKRCTRLTPEFWKKRSAWKKFVGWFANLFTPFL